MTRSLGARLAAVAAGSLLAIAGCAMAPAGDGDLTVFAAASLRDVFEDLEAAWESDRPGAELTIALDGSNILAARIAEGAPADVFASADSVRPRQLVDAGHAAGDPVVFARTGLSLVVPIGNQAVGSSADLARPGVRLVAAGPGVPITAYAEQALAQLAAETADPQGFLDAVAANVVSREDNVRAALAKVELGEADAAIVYRTDLRSSDDVAELPLEGVEVIADYAAVRVSDRAVAGDFLRWLSGPEAGAILDAAGFEVPGA